MRRRATVLSAALVLLSVSACPASRSASSVQARLRKAFASDAFAAAYRAKRLLREGPFARMVIPKLRVDVIVAEGTTGDSLRGGAGHYVQSPFPGEDGNVAIACVRDARTGPCHGIDRLREGDEIHLIAPGGGLSSYAVLPAFGGHTNPWVTTPHDLSTLEPTDYPGLTLTTTDPPGSSTNRLIVRLRFHRAGVPSR